MSGIMGNPRKLAEFLKDVASSLEGVKVLVLFGSYAEDRAMPASDLDLAVVAEDLSNIANLRYAVAKGLKMPEQKVSIVELMHAPPTLKAKILKRGVVIFGDIGEIARSVKPDVIEVLDLEKARFYDWLRGKNPIDESVVTSIIDQVESDVRFLREIVKRKSSEVAVDEVLRRAFERALHTAIEGVVDLLRHIVSGLNLGMAEYYKDYVEISAKNNVISRKVAQKTIELVELRHRLVHAYRGLNYEEMLEKARELVTLWPQILIEVKGYLRKKVKSE